MTYKLYTPYPFWLDAALDLLNRAVGNFEYTSLIENSDIVLFLGGADISPEIYGEINTYSITDVARDEVEINDYRLAKSLEIPMMGICRGHQLLNALEGGKLIQHLIPAHRGSHEISFLNNSEIWWVNSLHHQGVIEPGIEPLARHDDGTFEICRSEKFITFQYHPEIMYKSSKPTENLLKDWWNNVRSD
jgi:putative glutamine amidotransferase